MSFNSSAGQFGACFIPAMCKPEGAQLYACRPGARIWKADMNGIVSQTYLYKELLNSTHPEIQLLFKNGIPASRVSADHQFGPLSLYMEKYLVTWNDSSMYILCPEDNSVVGSQRALGAVVDVAVTEDEIFILRKNNEKNLIRLALYPEKKGGKSEFCNVLEGNIELTFYGFLKSDIIYALGKFTLVML